MAYKADELLGEQMCAVVHALIGYRHEARRGSEVQIQGSVVATAPARTCMIPKLFVSCVVAVMRVKSSRFWCILLHMKAQVPLHGYQRYPTLR